MTVEILMIGYIVGFIDGNMTIGIGTVARINENVALLRLSTLNSLPAGRKRVGSIIRAVSGRTADPEIIVIGKNQIDTLCTVGAVHVETLSYLALNPRNCVVL